MHLSVVCGARAGCRLPVGRGAWGLEAARRGSDRAGLDGNGLDRDRAGQGRGGQDGVGQGKVRVGLGWGCGTCLALPCHGRVLAGVGYIHACLCLCLWLLLLEWARVISGG